MAAELRAIGQATEADIPAVRVLMRRYVDWHCERHAAYRAMIDRYFDPVDFAAELEACPARSDPHPAGCSSPVSGPNWWVASACATSATASAR